MLCFDSEGQQSVELVRYRLRSEIVLLRECYKRYNDCKPFRNFFSIRVILKNRSDLKTFLIRNNNDSAFFEDVAGLLLKLCTYKLAL